MASASAAETSPSGGSSAGSKDERAGTRKHKRVNGNGRSSDDEDEDSDESSSSEEDDEQDHADSSSEDDGESEMEHQNTEPQQPPTEFVRVVAQPVGRSEIVDENSPLGVLRSMVQMAQICHFLQIFGRILKIPPVSRTELENGLIHGESSTSYTLLVEVFYRLCRDAGQKIEKAKMTQEWERVVQRKLADNWRREFNANPMPGPFNEVDIRDRALILHALCEWRLMTCAEITKHITTMTTPTKEVKDISDKFEALRPEALGRDDKGSIYWYFNDGCWVYAEDEPSWQKNEVKPPYHVRYSTPTKIRLSTHFGLENNQGMDAIVPSSTSEDRHKRKRSSKKESKSSHRKERSKRKKESSSPPPRSPSPPPPPVEDAVEKEPIVNDPPPPPPPEDDPDDMNIICSLCKKSYNMSHLDPPLAKKPQGEWKCFECLVNDCRGWPRRRPASRQVNAPPPPPPEPEKKEKKHKKKSKKSSSSSKKSSSSSKKSSSKKKSSRRHNSYPEEYKYLLDIYHTRKRQRDAAQIEGLNHGIAANPTGPTRWRVVSASAADLKEVIRRDFEQVGSVEQERLKGRLIQLMKAGEAFEEEQERRRLLQEQQMWQIEPPPRRQSSRVALERLKSQSDPKSDDEPWENKQVNDRALRLSRRSSSEATNGLSAVEIEERNKRKLAMERAHRASRRQRDWDAPSSDEEVVRHTRQSVAKETKEWVNWKSIHSNSYPLRTVCSALVSRLIQEEMAALFSRPVDPIADGCPDYLAIVKKPMDLGTVKKRCLNGRYSNWNMFKDDMNLIWSNCRLYNSEGALIVEYANALEKIYKNMAAQAEQQGVDDMKEDEKEAHDDSEEEYNKSSASSSESSEEESSSSSSDSDSDQPRNRHSSRSKSKPPPAKKRKPAISSSSSESDVPKRKATPTKSRGAKTIASSSDSSDADTKVLSKQSPPPPPLPPSTPPPPPPPLADPPSDSSSSSSYFSSSDDSD